MISDISSEEVVSWVSLNPRRAVSFRVDTTTLSYKVFRCESHEPADRLISLLDSLAASNGRPVPQPLARVQDWIVMPWVKGASVASLDKGVTSQYLLELLIGIHSVQPPHSLAWRSHVSPYLLRLEARVSRAASGPFGMLFRRALPFISQGMAQLPSEESILHSDVTPHNVVMTAAGQCCLIDNEAVSLGSGRAVDAWICASSLYSWEGVAEVPALIRAYDQRLPGSAVLERKGFFMGVLLIKKALKARSRYQYIKQNRLCRAALQWFAGG